jgi:hypothetical protein
MSAVGDRFGCVPKLTRSTGKVCDNMASLLGIHYKIASALARD